MSVISTLKKPQNVSIKDADNAEYNYFSRKGGAGNRASCSCEKIIKQRPIERLGTLTRREPKLESKSHHAQTNSGPSVVMLCSAIINSETQSEMSYLG